MTLWRKIIILGCGICCGESPHHFTTDSVFPYIARGGRRKTLLDPVNPDQTRPCGILFSEQTIFSLAGSAPCRSNVLAPLIENAWTFFS